MLRDSPALPSGAIVWGNAKPVDERDWATLSDELGATLDAIREQAPDAVIVVATYPTLLPASGTCNVIAMTAEDADLMRAVGDRLAEVTRTTAEAHGALVVDVRALGVGHDACSNDPWVTGWIDAGPAPFHPNAEGARATARAIAEALDAA